MSVDGREKECGEGTPARQCCPPGSPSGSPPRRVSTGDRPRLRSIPFQLVGQDEQASQSRLSPQRLALRTQPPEWHGAAAAGCDTQRGRESGAIHSTVVNTKLIGAKAQPYMQWHHPRDSLAPFLAFSRAFALGARWSDGNTACLQLRAAARAEREARARDIMIPPRYMYCICYIHGYIDYNSIHRTQPGHCSGIYATTN